MELLKYTLLSVEACPMVKIFINFSVNSERLSLGNFNDQKWALSYERMRNPAFKDIILCNAMKEWKSGQKFSVRCNRYNTHSMSFDSYKATSLLFLFVTLQSLVWIHPR